MADISERLKIAQQLGFYGAGGGRKSTMEGLAELLKGVSAIPQGIAQGQALQQKHLTDELEAQKLQNDLNEPRLSGDALTTLFSMGRGEESSPASQEALSGIFGGPKTLGQSKGIPLSKAGSIFDLYNKATAEKRGLDRETRAEERQREREMRAEERQAKRDAEAEKRQIAREGRAVENKPPTEGQGTTATYANRMEQSNLVLGKLEAYAQSANPLTFSGQKQLPDWANKMKSDEFQSYDQAKRNFLTAVLRKESGAVISPTEMADGDRQYFTMPGDSDEVKEQKRQNRAVVIANFAKSAGKAYTPLSELGLTTVAGTYKNPVEVGAAIQRGEITRDQAKQILQRDFGFQ